MPQGRSTLYLLLLLRLLGVPPRALQGALTHPTLAVGI